jgi:acyl-CoA synthetase (AMP-forming)/AMP-acid ligase II
MKTNYCRVMATMALRYRDNVALVNVERGRRYTFPEYHRLTNRIANMVHDSLGLRRGDTALLILDNDNLSLLHFPTIYKQEATFAFSNVRDSLEEHAWQIRHCTPKAVFIEGRMLDTYYGMLREHECAIVVMDRASHMPADVHCFWDLVAAASEADNDLELDTQNDIAVLRFTGGTTGRGKCAMYTLDNWMGLRDSAYIQPDFDFNEDTRYLALTPLSHAGFIPFLHTFYTGGTSYTLNTPDLQSWCETVQTERITHSLLVPTLLYRLLDLNSSGAYDLSSLRNLTYGAAPMAPAAVARLVEKFGQIFVQVYGATETLTYVSALNKRDHDTSTEKARQRLGSAGRVAAGMEIMIADDEGRAMPIGKTGEIWLRAQGTVKGYYGNPEGTAAEFVNGFWKSGDLGYLDEEGYLFIVDRKKDMIITGGFNVYAIEVEAALSEHPAVLMSAVVGVPHLEWGEAVHAEVILREGMTASADDLIDHTKARIGSYKAPKTVRFVDELPLSSVGKVLRRQVRQPYWDGRERMVN